MTKPKKITAWAVVSMKTGSISRDDVGDGWRKMIFDKKSDAVAKAKEGRTEWPDYNIQAVKVTIQPVK